MKAIATSYNWVGSILANSWGGKRQIPRTCRPAGGVDSWSQTMLISCENNSFRNEYHHSPGSFVYSAARCGAITTKLQTARAVRAKYYKTPPQCIAANPCCSTAIPWTQAAPAKGMPLARNSRHCMLPSRRYWASIRTAKYSRFAGASRATDGLGAQQKNTAS